MTELIQKIAPGKSSESIPSFATFDSTTELWKDYWARFQTFSKANSVSDAKLPQVFLTNQTTATYKLISTLAMQLATPNGRWQSQGGNCIAGTNSSLGC